MSTNIKGDSVKYDFSSFFLKPTESDSACM